jgi:argonaute-like protein implicated in RNA metabolism and viral defense
MTSEIYFEGEHPELTEAINKFCQWLEASCFKRLNRALWMREGTLNEDELDELRKLSSNLLFASRASGMMVKSYHFQTYMMDGEFSELSWRQESYDLASVGK